MYVRRVAVWEPVQRANVTGSFSVVPVSLPKKKNRWADLFEMRVAPTPAVGCSCLNILGRSSRFYPLSSRAASGRDVGEIRELDRRCVCYQRLWDAHVLKWRTSETFQTPYGAISKLTFCWMRRLVAFVRPVISAVRTSSLVWVSGEWIRSSVCLCHNHPKFIEEVRPGTVR